MGGPRLFVVISADGKKKYNILLRMPGYKIPPIEENELVEFWQRG